MVNPKTQLQKGKTVKLRRTMLTLAVMAGVAVGFITTALADDLHPAPWRGQFSTTSQFWEFMQNTPGVPILPDGSPVGGNPWLPSTHVVVDPLGPWMPQDPLSGRLGIWPLSGRMFVTVDNHNPPNDVKLVWVQLTWQNQDGQIPTGPVFGDFNPLGTPLHVVEELPLPFGWFHTTYAWEIYPNPPDEFFVISGNINVDELVIDTWCIPEPTGLVLACLGGGLLLVLRRRWAGRT